MRLKRESCRWTNGSSLKADDKVPGSGILTSHFSPGTTISLRDAIHLMIVFSDNTATNLVLDKLGLPATNEFMESLGCGETRINSKVFRRDTSIAPERSKKFGLGSTSARDMVKLCELLYGRKLVSEKACEQMLEHMFACDDKLKVPRSLPDGHARGPQDRLGERLADRRGHHGNAGRADRLLHSHDEQQGPDAGPNDNEGDLFCAEIGSAMYQYFNSDGAAPVAPVARVLQWARKATWSSRCSGRSTRGSSPRRASASTAISVRKPKKP